MNRIVAVQKDETGSIAYYKDSEGKVYDREERVSVVNNLTNAGIINIGMLFKNNSCSCDYKYDYSRIIVSNPKVKYADILEIYNKFLAVPKEYSDFATKTLQEKMEAELRVIRKNKYEIGLEAYKKSINDFK